MQENEDIWVIIMYTPSQI